MITRLYATDAYTDLLHYTTALVTENRGERTFRILTRQRKRVRMANACRHKTYQHFPFFGSRHIDFFDRQRLTRFPGHRGS